LASWNTAAFALGAMQQERSDDAPVAPAATASQPSIDMSGCALLAALFAIEIRVLLVFKRQENTLYTWIRAAVSWLIRVLSVCYVCAVCQVSHRRSGRCTGAEERRSSSGCAVDAGTGDCGVVPGAAA